MIRQVAMNHPDMDFITTHQIQSDIENLFFTGDITKLNEFDLNEVSYLSTFCSTLIGRNSGPHVFTQVKQNCMDDKKKLLSFTYQPTGASFIVNTPVALRKYWSGHTDPTNVVSQMEIVLNDRT